MRQLEFILNILRNSEGIIHSDQSPAYYSYNPIMNLEYYEWWNNGKIIAILSPKTFKYSSTGFIKDLQILEFPSIWKGKEKTLTPQEIVFFFKNLILEVNQLEPTIPLAMEKVIKEDKIKKQKVQKVKKTISSKTSVNKQV